MKGPQSLVENTSIHGIRYVFMGHLSRYTRVFWSIAVLASIIGLCFNNYLLYQKLNETPDINIRVRQIFASKVPFPAITVCNPLFAKDQLVNFFKVSKMLRAQPQMSPNLTIDEQNYLASNIHTCSPDMIRDLKNHVENRTENNIVKLLSESSMTLTEAIKNCGYNGIKNECFYAFNRVLTDRGYCYSFNLQSFYTIFNEKEISEDFHCYKRLNISKSMFAFNKLSNVKIDENNRTFDWSLDLGYAKDHEDDSVPVKAVKRKFVGFNPYLKESDTKNVCIQTGNVFSFFIHLPNEIMMPMQQEYYVEFKKKRDMIITAKSFTADEGMRKYLPIYRGCYFEGEKKLKFFKTYTKALCEYECMTNYTLKECGCVKFSMPRNSSTPICTVENGICYFMSMIKWPDYKKAKDEFEATCGCLKPCNDIKYEVKYDKVSSSDNVMLIFDVFNLSREDAISRISFMFDDYQISEFEEYASYKLQNYVADVGGLLGFFLGCSILSIIEILYFMIDTCAGKFKRNFKCFGRTQNQKIRSNSPRNIKEVKFVKSLQKNSDETKMSPVRLYYPKYLIADLYRSENKSRLF